MATDDLGVGVVVHAIALLELLMNRPHEVDRRLVVRQFGRDDDGERLDKHADTLLQRGTMVAAVADGQVKGAVLFDEPPDDDGKGGMHVAVHRDTVGGTESFDSMARHVDLDLGKVNTVGEREVGDRDDIGVGQHLVIPRFSLRHLCRILQLRLLVEGVVEGGHRLLLGLCAIKGSQKVAEEDGIRQSVSHNMMEVLEEPGALATGVDFQTIQVVGKKVEGSDALLEEVTVRLKVKSGNRDLHRGIVTAQLHQAAITVFQAGLDIAVGIDDQPEGVSQKGWGCLSEADGYRDVVLRGVAVQFPVYIDTALVGGQRVAVLFLVEVCKVDVGIGLLTTCRFSHESYCRIH